MDRSPRLQKIIEEITAICRREDIGALIVLHEPGAVVEGKEYREKGFTEFELIIDPSYSCITHEDNKIRVRAKAEDFNGDTEARDKIVYDTSHFLHTLTEAVAKPFGTLIKLSETMEKVTGYKHDKPRIYKGR